jgi:pimeloyl-ACP methyl ester carboxylesterase
MTILAGFAESSIRLPQASLFLHSAGKGRTFLFLHPGEGLFGAAPFLQQLSMHGHILVPSHPGFGRSKLPPTVSTVDDLSYLYLDLLDRFGFTQVPLIGASFGGWIAADIAIKNTKRISHLVLIDSLGIKVGGRDTRDITDMHALGRDALAAHLYHNPTRYAPDFMKGEPELAERYACDREVSHISGGSRICTTPDFATDCTGSTSRRSSCGEKMIGSSNLITVAPLRRRFLGRASSSFLRPATWLMSKIPPRLRRQLSNSPRHVN